MTNLLYATSSTRSFFLFQGKTTQPILSLLNTTTKNEKVSRFSLAAAAAATYLFQARKRERERPTRTGLLCGIDSRWTYQGPESTRASPVDRRLFTRLCVSPKSACPVVCIPRVVVVTSFHVFLKSSAKGEGGFN